ncbi:MAG TPA: carboxypeptidase-like regulatory domain-containing protein [Blastocatellia bacterium]|nr:carboxypeptidase-like regulatory domain-containing protein [Blastocatellia bacterium]
MRQATRLLALIALGAIAYVPAQAATGRGSIRGVVMDASGSPLIGAAVVVLADAEAAKVEKVVRRASTDGEGKFTASGIAPGHYRVKAEAEGFNPVELAADVKPNKVTVFDSIFLRRITALADDTSLNSDSKFAARRVRGTIFHYDEVQKDTTTTNDSTVALTERSTELHGAVNMFGQTTASMSPDRSSFAGANFAVSEQIGRDANLVVSGQLGYGNGAPQSLRAFTTAHAGDRHRVSVALGYGRFTFSRQSAIPRLGQFSVSATDTWQVSGPVLIVYGLEFARFAERGSGTSVLPRFGVALDAGARTRLYAGLVPGSSTDTQSRVNLESGEIEFSEPKPVMFAGGQPVMERSYRLQFGGEQILSDKSSLEVMAFLDTVSGHGVGLLSIPNDAPQVEPALRVEDQSGRTRGLRVVYHRQINKVMDGAVGYAFGEGQQLDREGITTPANLFSNGLFHLVSAKLDANFISTGTKVSTVLRLAPGQALFAIDPFQGQISTYDPNLSVSLTQELPTLGFIPGQWAAVVDLRNLLDQQASVADDRQELVASRFHRLIRVGLSLRF